MSDAEPPPESATPKWLSRWSDARKALLNDLRTETAFAATFLVLGLIGGLLPGLLIPDDSGSRFNLQQFLISALVGVCLAILAYVLPLSVKAYSRLMSIHPAPDAMQNIVVEIAKPLHGETEKLKAASDALKSAVSDSVQRLEELEARIVAGTDHHVTNKCQEFNAELRKWFDSVSNKNKAATQSRIEKNAWAAFIDAYFEGESCRIRKRQFHTKTDRFCALYWRGTTALLDELSRKTSVASSRQKVVRFHITGMLPEEFYNGPQIAYASSSSKPVFFCHKWEDYTDELYPRISAHERAEDMLISRCILVRDDAIQQVPHLGALSPFSELKDQGRLWLVDAEKTVGDNLKQGSECPGVLLRLLRKSGIENADNGFALVQDLLGETYHYWPIVKFDSCQGRSDNTGSHAKWQPLLDAFGSHFHTDSTQAFFRKIGWNEWGRIQASDVLLNCFRPGWMPEIALFGVGDDDRKVDWRFGFLGRYRPFTREIELSFLNGIETAELHDKFANEIWPRETRKPNSLVELRNVEEQLASCAACGKNGSISHLQ